MPKIGYDISNLENVFSRMNLSDTFITADMCNDLRKELNAFFTEANCVDVIYTNNIDKPFFGLTVMPVIGYDDTIKIFMDNEKVTIKDYYVELDSKLFGSHLTEKELTAYLYFQISNVILDDIYGKVRNAIDIYFCEQDKVINFKSATQYVSLLTFGIKDTIQKFTSPLYMTYGEIVSNKLSVELGLAVYMSTAIEKLLEAPTDFSVMLRQPKLSILEWVFNLYDDVKTKRIPALDTLRDVMQFTGSALYKKEINIVMNALNRIDTDIVSEGTILAEAVNKKRGLIGTIRNNGLRGIENDLYEFKIRIKNLQTEEEAMYTLKQINARLTLLQDAIDGMQDEKDYDKWYGVLEKYYDLREELSNKSIWNRKKYGIWYDYNALD